MCCTPCLQILVVSDVSSSFIVRCYLRAPHHASVNCLLGVITQFTIIDVHFEHSSCLSWTWYTLWFLENCRDVISIGSIFLQKVYFMIVWCSGKKRLSLQIQCSGIHHIPCRWVINIWGTQESSIISSYYNGNYPIIRWLSHPMGSWVSFYCWHFTQGGGRGAVIKMIRWNVAGYMIEEMSVVSHCVVSVL